MKELSADFKGALVTYLKNIHADYEKWRCHDDAVSDDMSKMFKNSLKYTVNQKYIRVYSDKSPDPYGYSQRRVHSFVVVKDTDKFKRGDILLPAGWAGPLLNHSRGNVFGEYSIQWTGPEYRPHPWSKV